MNYNNQEGNNNGNFQPQMPNNNGYMNNGPMPNGPMNQMPNNGFMNNQPMNNQPMNNQPMNNMPNGGYMNGPQMPNGPMNNMPNNNGYMNNGPMPNGPMNQMPNNGYMNGPQQGKKSNKMFLIIGAVAVVVVVAVVLIFALGGKKTLSCSQTDGNASLSFKLTYKKDEFVSGEMSVSYSNATQAELDQLKSADFCSTISSAASYGIGKCDTKFTSNSMKVTAEIKNVSGDMETLRSQLQSQGYSCN